MNSDGLAVEDEELLGSGLVCLASAPAEVMMFQRLPLSLCRVDLHLMYAMISGRGEGEMLTERWQTRCTPLLAFVVVDKDEVRSCKS
jgi:hypothetical protein